MPLDIRSQFNRRILESVQDKVKAEAARTGDSINKTAENLLLEALRARSIVRGK